MKLSLQKINNIVAVALFAIMFNCADSEEPALMTDCNSNGPVLFLTASNNDCGSNGSVEVMITGGTSNLSLSISPDPGAVFDNGQYVDLPPDMYTITVVDENSCSNSASIGLGITSYADVIAPIISSSCNLPTCHDGSNASVPSWAILSNVQDKASEIKDRTGNRSMPPDSQPPLDQEEIDVIACWVDLGAKDN